MHANDREVVKEHRWGKERERQIQQHITEHNSVVPWEELLAVGVPVHALARWEREMRNCTTLEQAEITAECHRIEAFLYSRWGRRC